MNPGASSSSTRQSPWSVGAFIVVWCAGLCALDDAWAISMSWPILAVVVALPLLATTRLTQGWPMPMRLASLASIAFFALSIRYIDWDSRKPFLRDLYSLRPGMSEAEVDERMGRYIRGTGWPNVSPGATGELTFANTVVFRHTNEGWGDSDWGLVHFDHGVVVGVEFSQD